MMRVTQLHWDETAISLAASQFWRGTPSGRVRDAQRIWRGIFESGGRRVGETSDFTFSARLCPDGVRMQVRPAKREIALIG